MRPIPITELLTRDQIAETPTLLSGISATSEPLNVETVLAEAGDVEVPIVRIRGGEYLGSKTVPTKLADYYEEIRDGATLGEDIPYLAEISYDEYFPTLAKRLVDPPEFEGERFFQRVMYFGRAVNSQIHYHIGGSAILFGLVGHKVVRLYAPSQTPKLYKVRGRNFSQVLVSSVAENTWHHDAEAFPEFESAEFIEFTVGPGDVLFIPIYWWHSIQNLDEISLSAVYFWSQEWRGTWRDFLPARVPPRHMRLDYANWLLQSRLINPLRSMIRK